MDGTEAAQVNIHERDHENERDVETHEPGAITRHRKMSFPLHMSEGIENGRI